MQGFYFCPATYELPTSVYSGFYSVHAIIQPKCQNRLQGFTAAFPLICPIPAHTIQQPHKPPIHRLFHAGGHSVKRCTCTDTRYYRHAGRYTSQHSRPIIIRYIRVQGCAPVMDSCQAVQHTTDHASPAACSLAPGQPGTLYPAEQSSSRGRGGRRGTTGGLSPQLFSGFRPIANRGQQ